MAKNNELYLYVLLYLRKKQFYCVVKLDGQTKILRVYAKQTKKFPIITL